MEGGADYIKADIESSVKGEFACFQLETESCCRISDTIYLSRGVEEGVFDDRFMIYLFFQAWLWILLAGLLGLFIGWLIWGRNDSAAESGNGSREETEKRKSLPTRASGDTADARNVLDEWRPEGLADADGQADNLQRIKGIGPVIETTLNKLGIFYFRQISLFTDENIKWVDNHIAFPGRIHREDWVNQAMRYARESDAENSD